MIKNEAATDDWVRDLLKDQGIRLERQASSIKEIGNALKSASKSGSGNNGMPDFIGVVNDFLLVIENKADVSDHESLDDEGIILQDNASIKKYATNGALHYAKHLEVNTTYSKIIAFGISGDEKHHRITPLYIDTTAYCQVLPDVESFVSFSEDNIQEYYEKEIAKIATDKDRELSEILKDAAALHEDLRNYGSLKDADKPLVVSGILLALREMESKNFTIDSLVGDNEFEATDGDKIFKAITSSIRRAGAMPHVKVDKILGEFSRIFKDTSLNVVNPILKKTPLKHFTEFLNEKLYGSFRYTNSSEDYLGRFYGEFMSYSGGDGQSLGIVLTPKHITDLFCDLVDIKKGDIVIDPCTGTAGFLVAAMHHMLQKAESESEKKNIKQNQLLGYELQTYMFTIATTNMILRGDGKSNLRNESFLTANKREMFGKNIQGNEQPATVGMINPPYSQGSKKNPDLYEISFISHMLDAMATGGRAIAIVPQSSFTGKTKEEKEFKRRILKNHTLEGIITLNKDTFYGVGVMPCIAVFTTGESHPKDKLCKFIDFRNDGYEVRPHIGLMETSSAKDKKQQLMDVWTGRRKEFETKFCVETTVEFDDEWLHSFYYFNDEIPTDEEFEKTVGDYLSFEFSMIMQNREYLFEEGSNKKECVGESNE